MDHIRFQQLRDQALDSLVKGSSTAAEYQQVLQQIAAAEAAARATEAEYEARHRRRGNPDDGLASVATMIRPAEPPPPMQPAKDMLISKYRLEASLRGGMGVVWKAWDTKGERWVALKFLPPELQGNDDEIARIRATFKLVEQLDHAHICRVFDLDEHPDFGWFQVMRWIEGQTLSSYRRDADDQVRCLSVAEVAELLEPVAEALDYAHSRKVLHRDIKPQNLMRDEHGHVSVVDFGLAAEVRSSLTRLSKSAVDLAGTQPYLAPELWEGSYATPQTDQYALGLMAYELLAGRYPFNADNPLILMQAVLNKPIPAIDGLPSEVMAVLQRCLARQPAERFEKCRDFARALKAGDGTLFTLNGSDTATDPFANGRRWVVSASGGGDFRTITEAINASEPYSTILVRAGTYRESLVLEEPLAILGDGVREQIRIEAADASTILSRMLVGRVGNLTLRQTGQDESCNCVEIADGCLLLHDCDISSECSEQNTACVAVHGADTTPVVRRNRIHDGKHNGVFVFSMGRGTFEGNDIFQIAAAGILVREESDPIVRENSIHHCKAAGVAVVNEGRGTFDNNDIFQNGSFGILVIAEGSPVVRQNRVHDGRSIGVAVGNNGQGTFEGNDIFRNTRAEFFVSEEGDPVVRGNRIYDSKGSGVMVSSMGRGTFEDNDIFQNAGVQFSVGEESDPVVRRNRIHDGETFGVRVSNMGRGTFESNDIFQNAGVQFCVSDESDPVVRQNLIHDGKSFGVHVSDMGRGTFEDNHIFQNADGGIVVSEAGDPVFRLNRITNNECVAIGVVKNGCGSFEQNDLRGNQGGAWDIGPDCQSRVKRFRNQE